MYLLAWQRTIKVRLLFLNLMSTSTTRGTGRRGFIKLTLMTQGVCYYPRSGSSIVLFWSSSTLPSFLIVYASPWTCSCTPAAVNRGYLREQMIKCAELIGAACDCCSMHTFKLIKGNPCNDYPFPLSLYEASPAWCLLQFSSNLIANLFHPQCPNKLKVILW